MIQAFVHPRPGLCGLEDIPLFSVWGKSLQGGSFLVRGQIPKTTNQPHTHQKSSKTTRKQQYDI